MSPNPGNPNIFISPDLTERQPWAPFRYVNIDAAETAELLRSRSWEMPDQAIEKVDIEASPDRPDRLFTIAGVTTRTRVYHSTAADRATVYMGNVHNALIYPEKMLPLAEWESQKDASGHLVEALSYARDEAVMGKTALAKERKQAETDIAVKKAVPRALGALATGALLGIGAYLNHKYNVLPETTVNIVGAVGTAAAGLLAWKGSKAAIRQETYKRTVLKQWPVDLRARARRKKYQEDRMMGLRPELVTYQVNT